jgi:hypothetical protein
MKKAFDWLAPIYVLGYFIIYKLDNPKLLDNYILGGIGLFFIAILYKLYLAVFKSAAEKRNEELFRLLFSLVVLIICILIYQFY